ncbi:MAG: hypothetical protein LBP53_07595 [Candidatus Peribacteria bacterium]|nr:hypothetical protein [Candidatus Peribacteria bacterium]
MSASGVVASVLPSVVLVGDLLVLDFSSAFFFLVPVPKRLSSRLSNRDFLAFFEGGSEDC